MLLAIVLDTMLFTGPQAALQLLPIYDIVVGGVFGVITYKLQRAWYGDDRESALIKALVMGLITAIPSPLPTYLTAPAGVIGLVNQIRKRGQK
jgi:hypothetical protein